MTQVPKEIIIVEGRDDTKRLIETFGPQVKTIETNGSAVSRKVIKLIKEVSQNHGIIVFTDPDFQGERIRRIISEAVPNAKHAYLKQNDAMSHREGQSLGVEHASPKIIRDALSRLAEFQPLKTEEVITTKQLMDLKLIGNEQSTRYRQLVADKFHLGYINGKQLQKKLIQYQIPYHALKEYMDEVMKND